MRRELTPTDNLKNQSGVTLLLAVLIMSSLTLITLAVGSFAVQQLRASRAVALSEPTIAAADTGGELGLWAIKRPSPSSALSTCPSQTPHNLSNNTVINLCKSYGSAVISVQAGVPYTFFLYNPDDINGDADLLDYPYTWMTVDYAAGTFSATVDVTRADGSQTGISPSSSMVTPGAQTTVNISPVAQDTEGRLKVVLFSEGDVTLNVDTDRGMPGFPTVDSLACGSTTVVTNCYTSNQEVFTRRINITVPE